MAQLILASTSRYRLQLLGRLGLPLETQDPKVNERQHVGEKASALAIRLANEKASSVADRTDSTDAIIIGADQTAALDGALLRKPGDPTTALHQLTACQGKVVSFHTACTVIDQR